MSTVDQIQSLTIGIVGCGCSGLVALKEFHCEGHRCQVFERSNCLGGLYTQSYEEGIFVSSHLLTMFGDFIGKDLEILRKPRMLTFKEYVEYLNDYAEYFHLNDFIRYQSEVTKIRRDYSTKKWIVEINRNREKLFEFDRIVICSGTFDHCSLPSFQGEEHFQGKIRHLKSIKTYKEFQSKRICIVGSGESASDMILAASIYGDKSILSIRQDHGFLVPRYIHGNEFGPADLDTTRVHHSLPRQWGCLHTCVDMFNSLIKSYLKTWIFNWGKTSLEDKIRRQGIWMNLSQLPSSHIWNTFGTKNYNLVESLVKYPHKCLRKGQIQYLKENSIVFDDQSEEDVDEIICCTGFKTSFDYFDLEDQQLNRLVSDARRPRLLYKHCLHTDFLNEIYFIGFARPALGSVPPLIELQSRWCALLASNRLKLPSKDEIHRQIDFYSKSLEKQFTLSRIERLPMLTDFLIYSDDLSRLIGCRPNFTKLFFTEPFIWIKLMFGPLINAQYRLTGPHSQPEQSRFILRNVKWVQQPNVIYSIMFFFYSILFFVFRIESCRPATWN